MLSVMVSEVTDTVPVAVIVPDRFKSPEPLPHDMSTTRVPPEVVNVAHVCVPVASADESAVIVENVNTPPDAPGAAVADKASSASFV